MNKTNHFVDCKHKQMLKNGAPPDKFRLPTLAVLCDEVMKSSRPFIIQLL